MHILSLITEYTTDQGSSGALLYLIHLDHTPIIDVHKFCSIIDINELRKKRKEKRETIQMLVIVNYN